MHRNNDVLDLSPQVLNPPDKPIDIERGDSPLIFGGKPIGSAPLVHSRQKSQPQTVDFDDCRRRGFVQVHAGPKMPESKFSEQASQLSESAVETVERMIVGKRQDVETGRRNRTHKLRRADDPRLGWDALTIAGQREFKVGEQHAALGQDRANVGRNQTGIANAENPLGTLAEQQISDGGNTHLIFDYVCHVRAIQESSPDYTNCNHSWGLSPACERLPRTLSMPRC